MLLYDQTFEIASHCFRICASESCLVRRITLSVMADSANRKSCFEVAIYQMTKGDYLWNTLVGDDPQESIDLQPAIDVLKQYAHAFASEHPQTLCFSTQEKAQRFSDKTIRRPVNFRGLSDHQRYPGN